MAKQSTGRAGKIGFTLVRAYRANLERVWNAATQANHINEYFTDGSKGDFREDLKPVTWQWKQWGTARLNVTACKPMRYVEYEWTAEAGTYRTTVRFEFSRQKGRVLFKLSEYGWKQADLADAFDHCGGWTDFLANLKAYLYYGMDLRK